VQLPADCINRLPHPGVAFFDDLEDLSEPHFVVRF
jgi:hypothetical protein